MSAVNGAGIVTADAFGDTKRTVSRGKHLIFELDTEIGKFFDANTSVSYERDPQTGCEIGITKFAEFPIAFCDAINDAIVKLRHGLDQCVYAASLILIPPYLTRLIRS